MTSTLSSEYILVVDDVPANLKAIVQTLTDEGYEVSTAISGERALKQISYDLPDLILLDIQMPGIDGFETCKRLKENPETKHIPVIFMTSLSDSESIVKGFTLGAVDYITKPFQAVEVLARVKTHIHLEQLRKNLEKEVANKTNELTQALEQLKITFKTQLIKTEKMSEIGELMAGIANELNHPIGSIHSNSYHMETYIKNLLQHLSLYQQNYPNPVAEIIKSAEDIDLDFISQDLPNMITAMMASSERIKYLSSSLRTFGKKASFQIHENIDHTLLILNHRLKANQYHPAIEVVKKYGDLPKIECFPGQLNQVFMNLISHAIDAINEFGKKIGFSHFKVEPKIIIQTLMNQDKTKVIIIIKDNGVGMSEEARRTVFDQVVNNKTVAKGTGLGLSITHKIVVENHHGKLCCESALNQGSEFILELPIE
ncbi:MAG: hybrid sensor histidine kinase/response regulator [Okeania sp. SIO3I5]|uniref:hybrid sensor histidine kinase/response regulator n=1 Tax=Okeania sp. SIO3I5 TaxID=2607805 RepID=UPI0013BA0F4E|nr:hybrid sensor histidine kinase/response regulator [Okeania sp. SIO3I5]NEQ37986.1 hybrid sensor histidine kinase/response regulator [Okeania sp. SIO3I5]